MRTVARGLRIVVVDLRRAPAWTLVVSAGIGWASASMVIWVPAIAVPLYLCLIGTLFAYTVLRD